MLNICQLTAALLLGCATDFPFPPTQQSKCSFKHLNLLKPSLHSRTSSGFSAPVATDQNSHHGYSTGIPCAKPAPFRRFRSRSPLHSTHCFSRTSAMHPSKPSVSYVSTLAPLLDSVVCILTPSTPATHSEPFSDSSMQKGTQ